jgi:hypothetical protein
MWRSGVPRDVPAPVETARQIGGSRVHRFQVVREPGPDGEEWIVVGFDGETVQLADQGFEWTRTVSEEAFRDGRLEPVVAGGVPVWGY